MFGIKAFRQPHQSTISAQLMEALISLEKSREFYAVLDIYGDLNQLLMSQDTQHYVQAIYDIHRACLSLPETVDIHRERLIALSGELYHYFSENFKTNSIDFPVNFSLQNLSEQKEAYDNFRIQFESLVQLTENYLEDYLRAEDIDIDAMIATIKIDNIKNMIELRFKRGFQSAQEQAELEIEDELTQYVRRKRVPINVYKTYELIRDHEVSANPHALLMQLPIQDISEIPLPNQMCNAESFMSNLALEKFYASHSKRLYQLMRLISQDESVKHPRKSKNATQFALDLLIETALEYARLQSQYTDSMADFAENFQHDNVDFEFIPPELFAIIMSESFINHFEWELIECQILPLAHPMDLSLVEKPADTESSEFSQALYGRLGDKVAVYQEIRKAKSAYKALKQQLMMTAHKLDALERFDMTNQEPAKTLEQLRDAKVLCANNMKRIKKVAKYDPYAKERLKQYQDVDSKLENLLHLLTQENSDIDFGLSIQIEQAIEALIPLLQINISILNEQVSAKEKKYQQLRQAHPATLKKIRLARFHANRVQQAALRNAPNPDDELFPASDDTRRVRIKFRDSLILYTGAIQTEKSTSQRLGLFEKHLQKSLQLVKAHRTFRRFLGTNKRLKRMKKLIHTLKLQHKSWKDVRRSDLGFRDETIKYALDDIPHKLNLVGEKPDHPDTYKSLRMIMQQSKSILRKLKQEIQDNDVIFATDEEVSDLYARYKAEKRPQRMMDYQSNTFYRMAGDKPHAYHPIMDISIFNRDDEVEVQARNALSA